MIARCSRESDEESTPPYSSASRMVPSADLFPVLYREAKISVQSYPSNSESGDNDSPETLEQPLENTPSSVTGLFRVAHTLGRKECALHSSAYEPRGRTSGLTPQPPPASRRNHTRIYTSAPQLLVKHTLNAKLESTWATPGLDW